MEQDDCVEKDVQLKAKIQHKGSELMGQLLKLSHKCQSITSFKRLCCFVIQVPLYMNVTLSSVRVSLYLVLSDPDHISRLILQDHIYSVLETWWVRVDICLPLSVRLYHITTIQKPSWCFVL